MNFVSKPCGFGGAHVGGPRKSWGTLRGMAAYHLESALKRESLVAAGHELFTNEGLRCGCGKVATRHWKNKGQCSRCYAASRNV